MALAKDITNNKYGRLQAVSYESKRGHLHMWLFKCDCGNERIMYKNAVTFGNTQSCGCLHKERTSKANSTHGLRQSRIYRIWTSMNTRCYNRKCINYERYGGRGISIDWKSFEDFYKDMNQQYEEHISACGEKNTQIDRIDVNKNYSKENCRWVTIKEQANNKRNSRNKNFIINKL